jgi:radical SAM superfamily enzyme YgiQ (UPF0313 family)
MLGSAARWERSLQLRRLTVLALFGPHPLATSTSITRERLAVVLLRPSKYDDDGYVIRHWRGTLPSNTLSCLNSLTEDAVQHGGLDDVDVEVEAIDEIVSRVRPARIARRLQRSGARVLVALAGVQTNQFPRARDLALQFKAAGCAVMVGGFHVSGAMALAAGTPPECQELLDAGVTLVLGEVEDHWANLLRDAASGALRPLYDFLASPPDLADKPLPRASRRTQRKFVLKGSGTIDAGRGCPFSCSFCTIINVQGRRMRCRSSQQVLRQIRDNYWLQGSRRAGVRHYFFTDDNFSRNPEWEAIFDGLIEMRQRDGMSVDFMMQVDVLAPRIPNFVEKAARAGCVQVFIGLETVRDDNLDAGGKKQNKAADYRAMIAAWHEVGVVCHVGYIIGFPHDTYERVMQDVRTLRDDLLVDQVSFFMLTPLPGSRDHQRAVAGGLPMDADYNRFDSFHATTPHPRMSREEWERAFEDAWREFYSFDAMRRILLRQNPHTYWGVLKNFIWYRAGMIEGAHPMITGFFRLKARRSRRPGLPRERRLSFAWKRLRETAALLRGYGKVYLEMQDLWLQTRIRRDDYAPLGDLRQLASRSMQDVKVNWAKAHAVMSAHLASLRKDAAPASAPFFARLEAMRLALSARAGEVEASLADLRLRCLPPLRERSWAGRLASRLNLFSMRRLRPRPQLHEYWERTWRAAWRFQFWRVNPFGLGWRLARDTREGMIFLVAMWQERY